MVSPSFHLGCPLRTVRKVGGYMEPDEHHLMSSAVPYMLLVKQKASTTDSSAFTGVTEAVLPKGFPQSGTWICWFDCSGTIFIHGTRRI